MTTKAFKAGAIVAACFLFGDMLVWMVSEDGWARALGTLLSNASVLVAFALGYWAGRSLGRWAVALLALFAFVSVSFGLKAGDWQSARHLTGALLGTMIATAMMFMGSAVRNAQQAPEANPDAGGERAASDAGSAVGTVPMNNPELEANWVGVACVAALAWIVLWTADPTRGVSLLAWPLLAIVLGNLLGPPAATAMAGWGGWSKDWSAAPNRFQVVAGTTFVGIASLVPAAWIWKRGWLWWLTPFAPLAFVLLLGPWIGVSPTRAAAAWLGAFALGLGGLAFMHGWSLDGRHLGVLGAAALQASLYTALVLALNHRQFSRGSSTDR